jgi:hypothetical protein
VPHACHLVMQRLPAWQRCQMCVKRFRGQLVTAHAHGAWCQQQGRVQRGREGESREQAAHIKTKQVQGTPPLQRRWSGKPAGRWGREGRRAAAQQSSVLVPVLDEAVPRAGGYLQTWVKGAGRSILEHPIFCPVSRKAAVLQQCCVKEHVHACRPAALPPARNPPPRAHLARLQRVPLAADEHLVVAFHAANNLQPRQAGKAGGHTDAQAGRQVGLGGVHAAASESSATPARWLSCDLPAAPPPHLCRLPVPHKQLALAISAHQEAAVPAEGRLARIACRGGGQRALQCNGMAGWEAQHGNGEGRRSSGTSSMAEQGWPCRGGS